MLMKRDLQLRDNGKILPRGGILFSFHFGVWELMPRSLKKLGYDLGIVVNRYSDDKTNLITELLDKFLYRFRSCAGVKVFYRDDAVKIVHFIKSGGLLGMLVDGDTFYSKFKKAQRLSCLCNVPLVPFAAYRKNGKGVLEINCDLGKLVAQRPFDYMWFYKSRRRSTR